MSTRPDALASRDRSLLLMNRIPRLTPAFAVFAFACGFGSVPNASAALRLPVVDLARGAPSGPAYVSDRLEIRLSPAAAAAARAMVPGSAAGTALVSGASAPSRRFRVTRVGAAAVDQAAASLGAWFENEFVGESAPAPGSVATDFTSFYVVHLPEGTDLESALARFRSAAGVMSADPIAVVPVNAVPNDSLYSVSSWFDQLSNADIHASAAWNISTGDTSIVVAVLDTGVLRSHPGSRRHRGRGGRQHLDELGRSLGTAGRG